MGAAMKVIVIGAGASGIIAAIRASKNHEVVLIDGNSSIGKKILLTGNGRCNYWSSTIDIKKYVTEREDALSSILTEENICNTYEFLEILGIYPRIVGNLYYPYSNASMSINSILSSSLENNNVTFLNNFKVVDIKNMDGRFQIFGENDNYIEGDKVIIACGGKTFAKTGSDGSIFKIIENTHNVIPLSPALTRINLACNFSSIENIRAIGKIRVIYDNKAIFEDSGEIHFTKNGVSGIVAFNASLYCSHLIKDNKYPTISIDFMPDIDDLFNWFELRENKMINKTLENVLESIFNYKLMFYLFDQTHINKNKLWSELSLDEKSRLVEAIKNFTFKVESLDDFENAQVTLGGVDLNEINPSTFESKKIHNLYFVGECLDVTGICGGYNLSFAFISGYLAGGAI